MCSTDSWFGGEESLTNNQPTFVYGRRAEPQVIDMLCEEAPEAIVKWPSNLSVIETHQHHFGVRCSAKVNAEKVSLYAGSEGN